MIIRVHVMLRMYALALSTGSPYGGGDLIPELMHPLSPSLCIVITRINF